MDAFDFTFLVEDPATAWNLGAERYVKLAGQYAALVKRRERLAIDINVVEQSCESGFRGTCSVLIKAAINDYRVKNGMEVITFDEKGVH